MIRLKIVKTAEEENANVVTDDDGNNHGTNVLKFLVEPWGKDGLLCMCRFIFCVHQCCDSHEDNGFAFHWSGQDGHQKIPNALPVQLGVGPTWGLQGIGGQGN